MENKMLCIACKHRFCDPKLEPCASCIRSTRLAEQGEDHFAPATEAPRIAPPPANKRERPSGRTLCFACKYMYADRDLEPCKTCIRHSLAATSNPDQFAPETEM